MLSFSSCNAFLVSDAFLRTILLVALPFFLFKCFRPGWYVGSHASHKPRALDSARAIRAFRSYEELSMTEVNRMQKSYGKISRAHKRIGYTLGYPAKLKRLAETVNKNTLVANDIAVSARQKADYPSPSLLQGASDSDLRDVREALRHFVRDWSGDGAQERSSVLGPILEILSNVPEDRRGSLEVLVPGSGLGRLAWEISKLGFRTSANELSPFMNLPFHFLTSPASTHSVSQHTIYPFAHWFSHQRSNDALFRPVSFPDEVPRLSPNFRHFEDDFLLLSPGSSYDYIVTQFFIDTAKNIISTLEQIHNLLKPGGTWINLGPLLWRGGAQASLELSLDEIISLSEMSGFSVDYESRRTIDCEYTADSSAMMKWVYRAELWVATKKA